MDPWFGGFVPYRKLELLAFKGIVPWINICVSTGVQSIHCVVCFKFIENIYLVCS